MKIQSLEAARPFDILSEVSDREHLQDELFKG